MMIRFFQAPATIEPSKAQKAIHELTSYGGIDDLNQSIMHMFLAYVAFDDCKNEEEEQKIILHFRVLQDFINFIKSQDAQ